MAVGNVGISACASRVFAKRACNLCCASEDSRPRERSEEILRVFGSDWSGRSQCVGISYYWTFAKLGFTGVCIVVFATRNKDLRQFSGPENQFCKSPVIIHNWISRRLNASTTQHMTLNAALVWGLLLSVTLICEYSNHELSSSRKEFEVQQHRERQEFKRRLDSPEVRNGMQVFEMLQNLKSSAPNSGSKENDTP